MQSNSKNILLYLIVAILLSTIVSGSIVYIIENKQNTTTKNALQGQLNTLKQEIAALPTPTLSSPATVATCDTALSLSKLENAFFVTNGAAEAENSYQLTNGIYVKDSTILNLSTDYTACDTVTGNYVATIGVLKYATGISTYLEVFGDKGGNPAMVALAPLGNSVTIKSLTLSDGIIQLDTVTQGPNDAANNPTVDTKVTYKLPLSGNNLIKQTASSATS